jgi:ATP-dependent helicase/nuclease subunit B
VRVVVTRPGAPALDALAEVVRNAQRDDPLAPVTVVVPTNAAGVAARRALARRLGAVAAVTFTTAVRLAESIAGPRIGASGRRPATPPIVAAAMRQSILAQGAFAEIAAHASTVPALTEAHRVLRELSAVDDGTRARVLDGLARRTRRGADVVAVHREATRRLASVCFDEPELLVAATAMVRGGTLPPIDHVVLWRPGEPSAAAIALVEALDAAAPVTAVLAFTGADGADRASTALAERWAATDMTPDDVSEDPAGRAGRAIRVVTVTDADDEARTAVRKIVASVRDGVPLHRIAVLAPVEDPYIGLVAEQLTAAGIEHAIAGGRTLAERYAGRTLLRALGAAPGLSRLDLMALATGGPLFDADGRIVRGARWDRDARRAGVTGGIDHWRSQLIGQRGGDAAILAWVERLGELFDRAAKADRWDTIAAAVGALAAFLIGTERRRPDAPWPPDEETAAVRVAQVVERLGSLHAIEPTCSLATFVDALVAELARQRSRSGRSGQGVTVAQLAQAEVLDADVVIVLGLCEGLAPAPPRDDPLVPDRLRRELAPGVLPLVGDRPQRQLRHFLSAVAGARDVTLVAPRGDLRRGGERLVSRWVEMVAPGVDPDVSPSFIAGLTARDLPVSDHEHRLAIVARDRRAGTHRLASEVASIARSVRLVRARVGGPFGTYDGHIGPWPEGFDPLARPISPTAIETLLRNPWVWFARHHLGVAAIDDRPDSIDAPPEVLGELVHDVLEAFISPRSGPAAPAPDQRWTEEDAAALLHELDVAVARWEHSGRLASVHPVRWQHHLRTLRRDLLRWLDDDSEDRRAFGARPLVTELAFGDAARAGTRVEVSAGERLLNVVGRADRIDECEDGSLVVIDYKTGSTRRFQSVSDAQPTGADRTLVQLPIYAEAARVVTGRSGAPVSAQYRMVAGPASGKRFSVTVGETNPAEASLRVAADLIARGVFPIRAAEEEGFGPGALGNMRWVSEIDPDGLGTAEHRHRWMQLVDDPALREYVALVDGTDPIAEEEAGDA